MLNNVVDWTQVIRPPSLVCCWPTAEISLGGEIPPQFLLQEPPFADVGDSFLPGLDREPSTHFIPHGNELNQGGSMPTIVTLPPKSLLGES